MELNLTGIFNSRCKSLCIGIKFVENVEIGCIFVFPQQMAFVRFIITLNKPQAGHTNSSLKSICDSELSLSLLLFALPFSALIDSSYLEEEHLATQIMVRHNRSSAASTHVNMLITGASHIEFRSR